MRIKNQTFKWYFAIATAFIAVGCQKVPNQGPEEDIVVITLHDKDEAFSTLKTFSISDSIGVASNTASGYKIGGPQATAVLANIVNNLTSRGFVQVNKNLNPDMAVVVTAIKMLNVDTYYYPGYWYGYWGYYDAGYWGYPGYDYYYPWSYTYVYNTGSFMVELADLKHEDPVTKKITIAWSCLINGYLDSSTDSGLVNKYVDKGFEQSEYIKAN